MRPGPVQHWSRSSVDSHRRAEDENAAIALFQELAPPPVLSPTAWARIMSAVRQHGASRRWSFRLPRLTFTLALAAILAMGLPLSVALGWRGVREAVRHLSTQGLPWVHPAADPPPARLPLRADRPALEHASPVPVPEIPPAPLPVPAVEPAPVVRVSRAASTEVETAESARLFRESQMVGSSPARAASPSPGGGNRGFVGLPPQVSAGVARG